MSNIIEQSSFEIQPQSHIQNQSNSSLKQVVNKVKTMTSLLGMISKNNSVLNTERMPKINNSSRIFDPNERNKSSFRSNEQKDHKEDERELKIPNSIKLAPILSRNTKGILSFAIGDKKMSFIDHSSQSHVSLSLKYKIEEMKKTKSKFLTEIGMQKRRIHKTVFK